MSTPRHITWTVLVALALIALASRWRIIAEFAQPVPFHDQWTAEGEAIFEPWFAGQLGLADFWKPSNEHRPVLARALAFAEFRLTGEWNTRLQMLVNSLFYALTAVAISLVARRVLGTAAWVASAAAFAMLFALPGNYENAMWGFQSNFYLMMLLGAAYLTGTFRSDRIDATWGIAQCAGALGLLAMGGGMLAPAAAAAIAAVRLLRQRDARTIGTLVVAVILTAAGWFTIEQPADPAGVLQSRSPALLVESLLKLLAWPSTLWFLVPLIHAPWLLVAIRALRTRVARPGEIALAALGAWIVLQALAIAYSRGAGMTEIPPRYFDSLIVGFLANGLCLVVLLRSHSSRTAVAVIGIAWSVAAAAGLWHFNRPERTSAFLAANSGLQKGTLEAVRGYIQTGDPVALLRDPFIAHHFPSESTMRRLLDDPGVRASLPSAVRGDPVPTATERFTNGVLGSWPWVAALGVTVLCAAVAAILVQRLREPGASTPLESIPWFAAAPLPAIAGLTLLACGLKPWDSDPHRRFERIFAEAGAPVADFNIAGAAGAIYPTPETPAAFLHGTLIDGDAFKGEKASTEFALDHKFVIVPVTGYPVLPGNSLRLEVLAPGGSVAKEFAFSGRSPRESIAAWNIAIDAAPGARARLVLVDGTSGHGGWLGVGTPLLTDDPDAARRLDIALASAGANNARRFPAVLFAASVLCAAAGVLERRSALRGGLASPNQR